jgi:hypothetical protein
MVGILILATTILTGSSVAAYGFMLLYTGKTLWLQMNRRARGIALFLAIVSFAVCVGSGAMLGYLLKRV